MKNPHVLITIILLMVCSYACKETTMVVPDDKAANENQYVPEDPSSLAKDKKLEITSATVSEFQSGTPIENAFDNDYSTLYHSLWDCSKFPKEPVVIEATLKPDTCTMTYMVYHPRGDGNNNGNIEEGTLYIKSQGDKEYKKVQDLHFDGSNNSQTITLTSPIKNPRAIKLVFTKGVNDFISISEIEFFQKNSPLDAYQKYFTDETFTELQSSYSREALAEIDNDFVRHMALSMFDKTYDYRRIDTYRSYPKPEIKATENKTSTYGLYDNITGLYLREGEEAIVFLEKTDHPVSLRIVNHEKGFEGIDVPLKSGANRFTSPSTGLCYLIIQDEQNLNLKVHCASGAMNGYFDSSKNTREEWESIIQNAKYNFFDMKGKYAHLTFSTGHFSSFTDDPIRLLEIYDSIVYLEQKFIGLEKYDRMNASRMYFRENTDPNTYMYSTSYHTEYATGTTVELCDPHKLRTSSIWGPCHEVGHSNQTRPGLKWVGTTEVTNNIYALYLQTTFGNPSRVQDEELYGEGYHNRYEKAFTQGIAKEIPHCAIEDVFCKLIPFWQLQLYCSVVQNDEDFYKRVHERIRTEQNPDSDGACQLNFVKICSEEAKLNLTDFFSAWGFLTPVDTIVEDYSSAEMKITPADVDRITSSIQKFSKPKHIVQYITDANISLYQNGSSINAGTAKVSGNTITITGASNVVAFEVWRDNKRIFISPFNEFTLDQNYQNDITIQAISSSGSQQKVRLN